MAPKDAAKALQSNRPRPTVAKHIIPAIPLPYMTKRHLSTVKSQKETQEVHSIPEPPTPSTDIAETVNGSSEEIAQPQNSEKVAPVELVALIIEQDKKAEPKVEDESVKEPVETAVVQGIPFASHHPHNR
jgi:hypothetical protein